MALLHRKSCIQYSRTTVLDCTTARKPALARQTTVIRRAAEGAGKWAPSGSEPAHVQAVSTTSRRNAVNSNVIKTSEQATAAEPVTQQKQFNWFKAWYPLAVLEDLDPALPSRARLLGMDLAIWYDKNANTWRAFQDHCPHRLAPLSEGRIDANGNLYCNYHGWQFDGTGSCQGIPQLPQGQAVNAKKSCAVSYPTCEREGLLWVWPDAGPAALVESAAAEAWPGLAPEIDAQGDAAFSSNHKWYFRDLPASYLAAKENAYNDCSHDTVLHHGASPFINRDNAGPIAMKVVDMTPTGYVTRESSGRYIDTIRFPCGARRDYGIIGGAGIAYVVPTGVGTCRQFHAFLKTEPKQQQQQQQQQQQGPSDAAVTAGSTSNGNGKSAIGSSNGNGKSHAQPAANSSSSSSSKAAVAKPDVRSQFQRALVRLWVRLQPTWAQHMMSHLLVDADLAMQSRIDVNRAANDHVYMPAAADAGPAGFMRWLRTYGADGPPVAKLHSPFLGQHHSVPTNRQQLLDRFNTHTLHCKACRTAYMRMQLAQKVVAVAAVVAAAAAVAAGALLMAAGMPADSVAAGRCVGVVVWLGFMAVVGGGVWAGLGRVLRGFVFQDYDRHHVSRA